MKTDIKILSKELKIESYVKTHVKKKHMLWSKSFFWEYKMILYEQIH